MVEHKFSFSSGRNGQIFWLAVILILTILAYFRIFQNDFLKTWDDNRYVIDNPYIRHLDPASIGKMFTVYFDGHYHPLTLLSLAADFAIDEANPVVFHATNLILHLLNTVLVFWFLYLLFRKKSRFIPLITALLFALAPIQVESVAWASERKNLLYAAFYLGSLIAYIKYIQTTKSRFYWIALLLLVLSVLSKAMAVSLVLTLVVIDYFYERKLLSRKVIQEKIPFLVVTIIFGIVAVYAQKSSWGEGLSQVHYSFPERIMFAGDAFVMYFVRALIPYKLAGFYPYPAKFGISFVLFSVFAVLIALGTVVTAFLLRKKSKAIVFGILIYVFNIFFLLKLFEIPAGDYLMADRYAYVASIGVFFIVAIGTDKMRVSKSVYRNIFLTGLIGYTIFISYTTFQRVSVWGDDQLFYSDIISKYPDALVAYTNRGAIRKENGNYQGALADFNQFLKRNKKDYKVWANRAAVYSDMGKYENALSDYQKAVALKPNNAKVLASYGFVRLHTGDFKGAIETLDHSLKLQPENPEALTNRGTAKYNMGDLQAAIQDFSASISQDTNNFNAYYNKGLAEINTENLHEAIDDFEKSLKIKPNSSRVFSNMGIAWSKLGNREKAFQSYDSAMLLDPDNFEAWLNRGIDKFYDKNYLGALEDLNQTIRLQPQLGAAYYFRALASMKTGNISPCDDLQMALKFGFKKAIDLKQKLCK